MTTGKTKASTRWTFVGKLMPLLFNMLSRLVQNYISVILLWTPDLHVQLPTWCLHSFGFLLVISVGTYAGLSTRLSWSHCSSDSPPQCHKWQNPYSSLLSPKNSQIFLLFLNSSISFASLISNKSTKLIRSTFKICAEDDHLYLPELSPDTSHHNFCLTAEASKAGFPA